MTSPSACPACGAAVRPDAPWCTLCYADLRPAAVQAPAVPEPAVAEPVPPVEAVPVQQLDLGDEPSWPCTTCGASNPLASDTCRSCGAGFLAAARDTAPLLELPLVGDITRLGRGQRFAVAGAVVLAFLLLTLVVGLLFS